MSYRSVSSPLYVKRLRHVVVAATALLLVGCSDASTSSSKASTTAAVPTTGTSTTDDAEPTSTTKGGAGGPAKPTVEEAAFDLGDVTEKYPDGTSTVLHRRGRISTPKADDHSAPVVFVLGMRTGNVCSPAGETTYPCSVGTTEIRYDVAYPHVVDALTKAGNVVVVVEMNSIHSVPDRGQPDTESDPTDGLTRINKVAEAVLTALDGGTGAEKIPEAVRTVADPKRVMVIGHSHGAELALQLPKALIAVGRSVIGVLALAPSVEHLWGRDADPNLQTALPDVPTAITVGGCDGDTRLVGLQLIDRLAEASRTKPITWVMLPKATHVGFADHPGLLDGDEGCGSAAMAVAAQRTWLADAAVAFEKNLLAGDPVFPTTDTEALRIVRGPGAGQFWVRGGDGIVKQVGSVLTADQQPVQLCEATNECKVAAQAVIPVSPQLTTFLLPPTPSAYTVPTPKLSPSEGKASSVSVRVAAIGSAAPTVKATLISGGAPVATATLKPADFGTPFSTFVLPRQMRLPASVPMASIERIELTVSDAPAQLVDIVIEHT